MAQCSCEVKYSIYTLIYDIKGSKDIFIGTSYVVTYNLQNNQIFLKLFTLESLLGEEGGEAVLGGNCVLGGRSPAEFLQVPHG